MTALKLYSAIDNDELLNSGRSDMKLTFLSAMMH